MRNRPYPVLKCSTQLSRTAQWFASKYVCLERYKIAKADVCLGLWCVYVVCCLLYFFSYWEKRERGLFSRPLRALDARRESSEASELCTAIEDGAVGSPPSFTEAGDAYLS